MGDEEQWLNCPYNANHRMPSSRFQWHLVKCPEKKRVGHLYQHCPYNAQHVILKSELSNHKMKCPDRDSSTPESDEIDRQIREYLAKQHQNPQTWGDSKDNKSWTPAPQVIVGETLENTKNNQSPDTSSISKNQKRNAARRSKKSTEEKIGVESNGKQLDLQKDDVDNWEHRISEKNSETTPNTQIQGNPKSSTNSASDIRSSEDDDWSTVVGKKTKAIKQKERVDPIANNGSNGFAALQEEKVTAPVKKEVAPVKKEEPKAPVKQVEQPNSEEQKNMKKLKNCQKLLKQISEIEKKEKEGTVLNEDQKQKKNRKAELEEELKNLTIS